MTTHDFIEVMVGCVIAAAGWFLRTALITLRKLELKMEKCVTFAELGMSLDKIHREVGEHGERIARLEK